MSKLGCQCGEVIRDNTDYIPYKGYLFADTEFFDLFPLISRDVAAFLAARVAGTERQWLRDYFGSDYPYTRALHLYTNKTKEPPAFARS